MYRLNRSTLLFALIIMSLQCLLITAYCIIVAVQAIRHVHGHSFSAFWYHFSGDISACILSVDIILNVFLFLLFVRKLRHSMMTRLRSDTESMTFQDTMKQIKANTRILDVITKQTLIGTSVTFCSIGFAMTSFITETFGTDSPMKFTIAYAVRAVEGVMITALLYLGLYINDAEYKKLCGSCHRKCRSYGQRKVRYKVIHDYHLMDDPM